MGAAPSERTLCFQSSRQCQTQQPAVTEISHNGGSTVGPILVRHEFRQIVGTNEVSLADKSNKVVYLQQVGRLYWRRGWDSNPRTLAGKTLSRRPRYDHFGTSPQRGDGPLGSHIAPRGGNRRGGSRPSKPGRATVFKTALRASVLKKRLQQLAALGRQDA